LHYRLENTVSFLGLEGSHYRLGNDCQFYGGGCKRDTRCDEFGYTYKVVGIKV